MMRSRVISVVDMVINFRCQGSAGSDDLKARMRFPVGAAFAIILRELANCLYEDGIRSTRPGERTPAANPRLVEAPAQAFPAAGGWGSGRGWRLWCVDRREARGQPAHVQRASEDPPRGRTA